MTVLVIGGAGYIGSHMVRLLLDEGIDVVILDNLSTGFPDAIFGGEFICADFGDERVLRDIFARGAISAVLHFASFIQVGESVEAPNKYYLNNVANTLRLLNVMTEFGVQNFVFSSSAAVYGNVGEEPIQESQPCAPVNPYGRTKRMVEEVLADFKEAFGLRFFALRYFNAAGADPLARIGERHDPETHLIPLVLQAASGRRDAITVFGQDYRTRDGTCVRDYVHVDDLCQAHLLALRALSRGHAGGAYNLGNSKGYSIGEVIEAARRVTNREITVKNAGRRAGDPDSLIADASKIRQELGWHPKRAELETIVADAWAWELEKGRRW